jgi:hypothetical protein
MSLDEMRAMLDRAGVPRRYQRYQAPICCDSERSDVPLAYRTWATRVQRLANVLRRGIASDADQPSQHAH